MVMVNQNTMITEKATYYLVYAALVVVTFLLDNFLLKKTDKTSRIIGYILSIIVDLAIFGYGIYLYYAKGEDQTGFVLGGILCGLCLLCLLGRYWQNKEQDRRSERKE
jgi:asparagine N-glycosylation enzyme membrane subunit Stt3